MPPLQDDPPYMPMLSLLPPRKVGAFRHMLKEGAVAVSGTLVTFEVQVGCRGNVPPRFSVHAQRLHSPAPRCARV
jgi:hypothetical protein